jgi:hypothetical protein
VPEPAEPPGGAGDGEAVDDGEGEGVGDGVGEEETVGDGEGVGEGSGDGEGVGEGLADGGPGDFLAGVPGSPGAAAPSRNASMRRATTAVSAAGRSTFSRVPT